MEEDQGQNLFNVRILTFFFSECQIFHNYEIRVRILKKQQQKNRLPLLPPHANITSSSFRQVKRKSSSFTYQHLNQNKGLSSLNLELLFFFTYVIVFSSSFLSIINNCSNYQCCFAFFFFFLKISSVYYMIKRFLYCPLLCFCV